MTFFNWVSGAFQGSGVSMLLIGIVLLWSLIWKALALWKAAAKKQIIWFIVFLFVNTLGILEILYIYVFSKMKSKPREEVKHRRRQRSVKRTTSSRRKRRR